MLKLFVTCVITYRRSHYHKLMADHYHNLVIKYMDGKFNAKHSKRFTRYVKRFNHHTKRFWEIQRTIDKLQNEWTSKYGEI